YGRRCCFTLPRPVISFLSSSLFSSVFCIFFFNDTATTEIYTLSLHDALPICHLVEQAEVAGIGESLAVQIGQVEDRKSTRLNSSHVKISYAVFCLKKKKK